MQKEKKFKTPEEYEKDLAFVRSQLSTALKLYDQVNSEMKLGKIKRGEFFSRLSHDVRTPMNSLQGYSDLLLMGAHDDKFLSYARAIKSASNRLLTLFDDLVDVSNIEAGTAYLNEQEYSTDTLIKSIIHNARMEATIKELDFRIHIDNNIPSWMFGDITHIRHIINNLLDNSFKYTTKGYVSLNISCKTEGKVAILTFSVVDTGCGIKNTDQKKIIKALKEFNSNNPYEHQVFGLGLLTANYFSNLMNGELTFSSRYGKGSTFSFTVPQPVINSTPLSEEFLNSFSNEVNRILSAPTAKVLIVDDSNINLSVASNLLNHFDVVADTAHGGYEAIKLIEESKYDLVFMDHMMPDIDGIEATEKIRYHKERRFKTLPIVALTANSTDEARHLFVEHGFSDFISKPIDIDILSDMLYKWLPKSKISFKEINITTEKFRDKFTLAFEKAGINIDIGMSYTGGKTESYIEVIRSVIKDGDSVIEKIQKFSDDVDMENYRIIVHGLKSVTASIGCSNLSAYAAEHEAKSKENNTSYVSKNAPELIQRYKKILKSLKDIIVSIDQEAEDSKQHHPEPIIRENIPRLLFEEKVHKAINTLEDYEIDDSITCLNELKGYLLSARDAKAVTDALAYIDDFLYEDAIGLLKSVITK
ncbi:MAG: response regulator [Clostridiales bacterium]|nr:response regulator [Clostridiales bacterium]